MRERLHAFSIAVRRPMLDAMRETERRYRDQDSKRLYYLSMEFLMGRALGNNLTNLELYDEAKAIIAELGVDLEELESLEHDAALGNGGLGRLAACFLDSLASQNMPGFGYGINYEFGLFRQTFVNGYQHEKPDHWLDEGGSPWMIERPDEAIVVPVYGAIAHTTVGGVYKPSWVDFKVIVGVPYDMPIAGYGGETVNVLRLFTARSSDEFDIGIFNSGDYIAAVQHKINTEAISKILYPSDSVDRGRELRLLQEYFLVACSVRDIVKRYLETHDSFDEFAEKVAIQMNDTHPALTVVELMRMFIDDYGQPWEQAWATTVATCGYTNHTLLPEALEKWPFDLLERLLPRHLQIMQEINRRLLAEVERRFPGDLAMQQRVSLFDDGDRRNVRMGNLAMAGSHSINGVAALHSELVKTTLAPEFHKLYPERFNNKTNGVTPRRWLLHANRPLASLITRAIGDGWIRNLDELRRLELFVDDAGLLERLEMVKSRNKLALAQLTKELTGIIVDPNSMFDVQVKRMHEYKRQLLNILHVIDRYWQIVEDGETAARAAHVLLRRQGGAGLLHGQADHQVDPRGRRGRERRSAHARLAARRFPARLPRHAGRGDHAGGGVERADFDGGEGSVGHRQHEAGPQRRADDRHARRREHRDPRRSGRGEHLHLRPARRGGVVAPQDRLQPRALPRREPQHPPRGRHDRRRPFLPRRQGPLPPDRGQTPQRARRVRPPRRSRAVHRNAAARRRGLARSRASGIASRC